MSQNSIMFKVINKILSLTGSDGDRNPKYWTYSRSNVPFLGAVIDYFDSSLQFVLSRSHTQVEKVHKRPTKSTLSSHFLAFVTLLLGIACNIKFEVIKFDEEPLSNDLHFMLLSKEDKLYIDDIDVSRVLCCVEAADFLVLIISCLLIWNSCNVRSPLSEYFFLPWMGVTIRGMFLRQVPTVGALIYTMAIINGKVDLLFLTGISFLFLIEARLWLEIARVVRARWELRDQEFVRPPTYEVETLWSHEDIDSIEVRNYEYY